MVAVPIHAISSHGSFVVCFRERFVAVRKDEEGLWVNQTRMNGSRCVYVLGMAQRWRGRKSRITTSLTFWKWPASSGLRQKDTCNDCRANV